MKSRPDVKNAQVGLEFLESSVKTPAGGYAIGLSVDEAWKLEGFHPRPDSPTMVCSALV